MTSTSQNDLQPGENNPNQSQPPPEIVTAVEKMALWVYRNGWEFEMSIMDSFRRTNNAKYNFMIPSDPYHRFYKAKVAEYYGEDEEDEEEPSYLMPVFRDPSSVTLTFRVPEGMMRKELDVIKLTACFSARYGKRFWKGLTKRVDTNHEFDFMKESDSRRSFLTGLCMAYWYMMPKKYLVRNEAPDLAHVLEDFFNRLRCVNERWQKEKDVKAEMVIVDCRPFFDASIDYANCEDALLQPPQIPAGARLPLPRASRFTRNPLIPSPLLWMRLPRMSSPSQPEKASLSLPE